MSEMRRKYIIKLIARCCIFVICGYLWATYPQSFDVLDGMNFFFKLSPLHLLWLVWEIDMLLQIVPIKNKLPLGSQKLFANRFQAAEQKADKTVMERYITAANKGAYLVFVLWMLLTAAIGLLYNNGIIERNMLFMISVFFYICDLICVLIWCPFRLMMKTRCCTTCRIFNWDHLMMFSPLIFMGGFYAVSLVIPAVAAWAIWELFIIRHPERFWEGSNVSLRCSQCTDKLCTQFCRK